MPGISSIPAEAAQGIALPTPWQVSWSVSANAASPTFFASATRSSGVRVPSDSVECTCKSIIL